MTWCKLKISNNYLHISFQLNYSRPFIQFIPLNDGVVPLCSPYRMESHRLYLSAQSISDDEKCIVSDTVWMRFMTMTTTTVHLCSKYPIFSSILWLCSGGNKLSIKCILFRDWSASIYFTLWQIRYLEWFFAFEFFMKGFVIQLVGKKDLVVWPNCESLFGGL